MSFYICLCKLNYFSCLHLLTQGLGLICNVKIQEGSNYWTAVIIRWDLPLFALKELSSFSYGLAVLWVFGAGGRWGTQELRKNEIL